MPQVDLIVIMSVEPGVGGQAFIPETLRKISRLHSILDSRKLSIELEVDGGITINNAPQIVKAGGNVLAIRTSVVKTKEGITHALQKIRETIS